MFKHVAEFSTRACDALAGIYIPPRKLSVNSAVQLSVGPAFGLPGLLALCHQDKNAKLVDRNEKVHHFGS